MGLAHMHRSWRFLRAFLFSSGIILGIIPAISQPHTVVRTWNEEVVRAIRLDLARPPIHARNLFHIHAAMYDAWAAYGGQAQPWLLGRTLGGFTCPFPALPIPADAQAARTEAMSFAAYRIIQQRYLNSPGYATTAVRINALMDSLGYDRQFTGTDPLTGGAAAVGNYIAQQYIAFGLQDGSNEAGNYANQYYQPVNAGLQMLLPGNSYMADPNRWQPITLPIAIDQAGNPVSSTPPFVSAEWGNVTPFCLLPQQAQTLSRDGHSWKVYMDPGPPAQLSMTTPDGLNSAFKWNHLLVDIWQSHLDPSQGVMWDVSPGARGNLASYPGTPAEYSSFYDLINGGDAGTGRPLNPVTGQPYAPNVVNRGDYTRVLAEFWADGVSSETPPGHWFVIFHDVMDKPGFQRRWMGQGPDMDPLEYDVKSHFALAGAMHDAAIVCWGIKGYYDSVRPVSAIRYMCGRGQCSDAGLPHYDPAGAPLIPGLIELVQPGDPLAGAAQENVNKIKLYTYRGPYSISDPSTQVAGVGWILADNWWPYQRPTFVTPPFAGYTSGHSTFSRSASAMLTNITGSPYFPGGIIEYVFPKNHYLKFEQGPADTVRLQWATYQDASDACSLSRIWGGIHPPMDDIPGRKNGLQVGMQAFQTATTLFNAGPPRVLAITVSDSLVGPAQVGGPFALTVQFDRPMAPATQPIFNWPHDGPFATGAMQAGGLSWTAPDKVKLQATVLPGQFDLKDIVLDISGAMDAQGRAMAPFMAIHPFAMDTKPPVPVQATSDRPLYNLQDVDPGIRILLTFDEPCNTLTPPVFQLLAAPDPAGYLQINEAASAWQDPTHYKLALDLLPVSVEAHQVGLAVAGTLDLAGNLQLPWQDSGLFAVDLRPPLLVDAAVSAPVLAISNVGSVAQVVTLQFDEPMDTTFLPALDYIGTNPVGSALQQVAHMSKWLDDHSCQVVYGLLNSGAEMPGLDVLVRQFRDVAGNAMVDDTLANLFTIDTRRPTAISASPSLQVVADAQAGTDSLHVLITFDKTMNTQVIPMVQAGPQPGESGTFAYLPFSSHWATDSTYDAAFAIADMGVEVPGVTFRTLFARDLAGNSAHDVTLPTTLALDTRNPVLASLQANPAVITDQQLGSIGFNLTAVFDEAMDPASAPLFIWQATSPMDGILVPDPAASQWNNPQEYLAHFQVFASPVNAEEVACNATLARDAHGNPMVPVHVPAVITVDLSGVGITAGNVLDPVAFFPNPLRIGEPLHIRGAWAQAGAQFLLFDPQGRLVHQAGLPVTATGYARVPMPDLSPGLYHAVLQGDGRRISSTLNIVNP